MDVTTDGVHLWVVNDAAVDQVFRYSLGGVLEGTWRIDPGNTSPTGLTIDPNNVGHVWIVDSRTDRVFQYTDGASRIGGQQSASQSFALNSRNGNAQGLALPRRAAAAAPAPRAASTARDSVWDQALLSVAEERSARDFLFPWTRGRNRSWWR